MKINAPVLRHTFFLTELAYFQGGAVSLRECNILILEIKSGFGVVQEGVPAIWMVLYSVCERLATDSISTVNVTKDQRCSTDIRCTMNEAILFDTILYLIR